MNQFDQPGFEFTMEQTLEAEKAVIGSVLLDQRIYDEVGFLESRDFVSERHQVIWRAIKYLADNNQPVDYMSVMQIIIDNEEHYNVGGVGYVTDLVDSVPTTANAHFHAERVAKYAIKRRAADVAYKIRDIAARPGVKDIDDMIDELNRLVDTIQPDKGRELKHLTEFKNELFEYLNTEDDFIPTGYHKFDEWSGGYSKGDLIILAGRPSAGKTAKALQTAFHIARKRIGVVPIFSQEMKARQLLVRMLSPATGIPFNKIRRKDLTESEKDRLRRAFEAMENLPLYIDDASGKSVQDIKAITRSIRRKRGNIACIFIDYLQIMNIVEQNGENRAQAIGRVTSGLKTLARELDAPIVLLSQLSRATEMKERPQLSDLKESGSIEQDADVIEFLYRRDDDYATYADAITQEERDMGVKLIRSFIAKGREIGVNEFLHKFFGYRQRFVELRELGL